MGLTDFMNPEERDTNGLCPITVLFPSLELSSLSLLGHSPPSPAGGITITHYSHHNVLLLSLIGLNWPVG